MYPQLSVEHNFFCEKEFFAGFVQHEDGIDQDVLFDRHTDRKYVIRMANDDFGYDFEV